MSLFTSIDLSELPPPSIVEELDYETILVATKTELQAITPTLDVNNLSESDPMSKLLEIMAYRELHLRQRINEAARGVMLATATDANLDNLAALVNIARLQTDPGDPEASPPVPPTYEDDERLRIRTQLAFEGFSTAGPQGAYIFHALSADPKVKDVNVYSFEPGVVEVKVLSTEGNGIADQRLLEAVRTRLLDDTIRPITDKVIVDSAKTRNYTIKASLSILLGVGEQEVLNTVDAAIDQYIAEHHGLGEDITRAGLFVALYQQGVKNVHLHEPAADLFLGFDEVPNCILKTISTQAYQTSIPTGKAEMLSHSLTDSDFEQDKLKGGSFSMSRALDETDLTHYVIYWGIRQGQEAIAAKIYDFNDDTLTLLHTNVDNLTITSEDLQTTYVKDTDYTVDFPTGVVTATAAPLTTDGAQVNISYDVPIVERSPGDAKIYIFEHNALTLDHRQVESLSLNSEDDATTYIPDTDYSIDQHSGIVTALSEPLTQVGAEVKVRYTLPPIADIPKTSDLNYAFPTEKPHTQLPQGATHLLVFSKNEFGEMREGVRSQVIDYQTQAPTQTANGITYTSSSMQVDIAMASNEAELSQYVLYWASLLDDEPQKLTITPQEKTFDNDNRTLTLDHADVGALVMTNSAGDTRYRLDEDYTIADDGQVITALHSDLIGTDIKVIISYELPAITRLDKTGSDLVYAIPEETTVPVEASHILVLTRSDYAEMRYGLSDTISVAE